MNTTFASAVLGTGTAININIDDYALRRIEFRVSRLARLFRLNKDHADDLRQDMVMELLKALPKFDLTRCGRRTFICRALNRTYKHMARMLMSRLRHSAKNPMLLGNIDLACNDPAKGEFSEQDLADMCMDIQGILPSMSPRLCRVAEAIMLHGCPAEAARSLGVHRSSVLRAVQELRQFFEAAGYGEEEIFSPTATNCPHTQK
jgi:DNA-directed RNA polymerase specialized sigma24 family protein